MTRMKKLRFVTLSPECRNIELVKDVGQIPYVLGKNFPIETTIAVSCVDPNGANLEEVRDMNIVHIPMIFKNASLTGMFYLIKNARKIDWLSVHHAGRRSYYWAKIYKLLNPKGKVYLKLDLDFRSCNMYDADLKERKIFTRNTQVMDLITVESLAVKERIQKYSKQEIKLLGNGYCDVNFKIDFMQHRENSFITVGRLGTKQKATEILLNAFAESLSEHNWNLKLVGTVEPEFEEVIKDYYNKYPMLKNRVEFLGEIKERKKLYDEYCKAKVFVLPSRWESFGIVVGEALACGCRLIISDQVPPAAEMTNNRKYGQIVASDDVDKLKEMLVKFTTMEFENKQTQEIVDFANDIFSWKNICEKLFDMMNEIE